MTPEVCQLSNEGSLCCSKQGGGVGGGRGFIVIYRIVGVVIVIWVIEQHRVCWVLGLSARRAPATDKFWVMNLFCNVNSSKSTPNLKNSACGVYLLFNTTLYICIVLSVRLLS